MPTGTFDKVMGLRVGQQFMLNGKCYSVADFGGASWGSDAKGEWLRIPVFPCSGGGERKILIRDDSKFSLTYDDDGT